MEKKKKQLYQAPELTIVAFKAERGYLFSSGTAMTAAPEWGANDYIEQRDEVSTSWAGNDW